MASMRTKNMLYKKVSFKSFDNHTEYSIQGINLKISHRDLVEQIFEDYPNFTGWIKIGHYAMKIKFKDGKIHANHNEPAISCDNKKIRIFVKHGIIQTYRKHDVFLFNQFMLKCDLDPVEITLEDMWKNGFIYLDDLIISLSYSESEPCFVGESYSYWHFYKDDFRLYNHIYVDKFMKRNDLTSLTDDDIMVFKFEHELEEE